MPPSICLSCNRSFDQGHSETCPNRGTLGSRVIPFSGSPAHAIEQRPSGDPEGIAYACVCGWVITREWLETTVARSEREIRTMLDAHLAGGQVGPQQKRERETLLVRHNAAHALVTWKEPAEGYQFVQWFRCTCGRVKFHEGESGVAGSSAVWRRHIDAESCPRKMPADVTCSNCGKCSITKGKELGQLSRWIQDKSWLCCDGLKIMKPVRRFEFDG